MSDHRLTFEQICHTKNDANHIYTINEFQEGDNFPKTKFITREQLEKIYSSDQPEPSKFLISACAAGLYLKGEFQCQIGWTIAIDSPDESFVLCTSRNKDKSRVFRSLDSLHKVLLKCGINNYEVFSYL